MKTTLEIINRMQADGVIGRYAIDGAVGATFYLEPVATLDIRIFISFQDVPPDGLISMSPIYDYLTAHGCQTEGEYIVIEGWPVQFLPPASPLVEEALAQAIETDFEGVPTRIMTAEHLTAIALETGRGKDHARILQFIESGALDTNKLDSILKRHGCWRSGSDSVIDSSKTIHDRANAQYFGKQAGHAAQAFRAFFR